ncbi:PAS-domain containing protein [Roseibium sp.]|uniref:PAS-domain containing protein n=1 Tax=Roseibium sp. TaxID=1936156 RepID=UPI003A9841A0
MSDVGVQRSSVRKADAGELSSRDAGFLGLLSNLLRSFSAQAAAVVRYTAGTFVPVVSVGDMADVWFLAADGSGFPAADEADKVTEGDLAFSRAFGPGGGLAIARRICVAELGPDAEDWFLVLACECARDDLATGVDLVSGHAGIAASLLTLDMAKAAAERQVADAQLVKDHFECFTELAGVGGWEIDPASHTVTWTEQTCRIHDRPSGYAPALDEWFAQCDKAYRDRIMLAYREAIRSGTGWKMDLPISTATGRSIWVSSICQPVFKEDGSVRLVGSLMDVSAKRGAQDEIDRSQRLYRSTLNALSEGILVAGNDGIVRWHNGAAEDILDCTTIYENMTHLADIACSVQPADIPMIGSGEDEYGDCSLLVGLLNSEESRSLSLQVKVGPDQVRKWLRCRSEPLVSREDGEFVGLVISVEDITTMKRNEDILNEAFEAIPNGFAIYDQDDRIVMANGSYRSAYALNGTQLAKRETYAELLLRNLAAGRFADLVGKETAWAGWIEERVSDYLIGTGNHLDLLDNKHWIQTSSRITPSSYRADYFADVTEIKNHGAVLEAVFESYPGGLALFDHERKLTRINGALMQLLEIDGAFLAQRPTLRSMVERNALREGLGEEQLELAVNRTISRFSSGHTVVYERVLSNGTVHEIKGIPMPDGGLLTILEDITMRRRYEERLKDKERQAREKSEELELTLASMEQGISVFDKEGRLQFWNQKYLEVFEKPVDEVYRGVTLRELLEKQVERGDFDGDIDAHLEDLRERLSEGEVVQTFTMLRSGNLVCCAHAPTPDGGWIGTQEEVRKDHPDYRSYKRRSQVDTVTGAANEAWLLDEAAEAVEDVRQKGGFAALMVLEPGYARNYEAGLSEPLDRRTTLIVAHRIRECIRPTDMLSRLDDGRFAVLYRAVKGDDSVLGAIATRVLHLLDAPFVLDGEKLDPSNHAGIVKLSGATDVREALVQAGIAAEEAGLKGRSAYVVGNTTEG